MYVKVTSWQSRDLRSLDKYGTAKQRKPSGLLPLEPGLCAAVSLSSESTIEAGMTGQVLKTKDFILKLSVLIFKMSMNLRWQMWVGHGDIPTLPALYLQVKGCIKGHISCGIVHNQDLFHSMIHAGLTITCMR